MAGSKPEELVSKLYDEGMTDDEVRAQLADFGLSGREIHVLIKKAKELRKDAKGKTQERSERKNEEVIESVQPEKEPPVEKNVKPQEEKKGGKSRFSGLFGKGKRGEPLEKPLEKEIPAAVPIQTQPTAPADDKRLLGEKLQKLNLAISGAPTTATEKPVQPEKAMPAEEKKEKKSFFSGLFGKKEKAAELKEPKDAIGITLPVMETAPAEIKATKPTKQESKKKEKGGRESKNKDVDYQAKIKRLSLIKEQICKPTSWESVAALSEESKPTPVKATTAPKKRDSKNITDEDTMDEETAKDLVEGIAKLETEMGEIKQLLETLRELNIKLVEIMEKK